MSTDRDRLIYLQHIDYNRVYLWNKEKKYNECNMTVQSIKKRDKTIEQEEELESITY